MVEIVPFMQVSLFRRMNLLLSIKDLFALQLRGCYERSEIGRIEQFQVAKLTPTLC